MKKSIDVRHWALVVVLATMIWINYDQRQRIEALEQQQQVVYCVLLMEMQLERGNINEALQAALPCVE